MQMFKEVFFCAAVLSTLTLTSCGARKDVLATEDDNSSTSNLGSIVNGKNVAAKNENAKSVVAIVTETSNGQSLCTGTLVSPDVILTAAHCTEGSPQKMHIIFSNDVKKSSPKNTREADKIIQQPNWTRHMPAGESDLALIHFVGKAPLGYHPVKLAGATIKLKTGDAITLMGFGVTDGDAEAGSGKLRQTSSKIIDRHSPTELITDGEKSGVCFGDSGGPAFIKKGTDIFQWGVASSVTSHECNQTSIHTEVMKYLEWIQASITKLQK
jgi:secreted trypsin-like serine protease